VWAEIGMKELVLAGREKLLKGMDYGDLVEE
jgi:hypothetical protein